MGSIVSALTGGGGSGVNFQARGANILNPATVAQADEQYKQAQNALQQQQTFVQALQGQNALQNQSNVFNQLQNIASGQGPNPAQAMLSQATGQNVANQAALMAGQRGAAQNVGLMARQAAQQGANTQQQAVGQAAQMQAQQSLGALQQMGGIAGTQAAQLQQGVQDYTGATQAEQQNILNAIAAQNNANVGMASGMNQANAGVAGAVAQGQMGLLGNVAGGLGMGLMLAAEGGKVPHYDEGGEVAGTEPLKTQPINIQFQSQGPKSKIGQWMQQNENLTGSDKTSPLTKGGQQLGQALGQGIRSGIQHLGDLFKSNPQPQAMAGGPMDVMSSQPQAMAAPVEMMAAKGGKVPALVSKGEGYLPPEKVEKVAKGKLNPIDAAEKIPGKPKYPGNDYRNDIVPKNLDEGGIVLPNSVMQSKHPHWEAHKFVSAILAKEGKLPPRKKNNV